MAQSREKAVAGVTSGLISLGEEVTWRAWHFGLPLRMISRIWALHLSGLSGVVNLYSLTPGTYCAAALRFAGITGCDWRGWWFLPPLVAHGYFPILNGTVPYSKCEQTVEQQALVM